MTADVTTESDPEEAGSTSQPIYSRLRWLVLVLLLLGVACRLLRYGLSFPFWGDEAHLCVNFLDRDYRGLMRLLEGNQVAPLFFLWSELTAFHLLGPSEWSMRLLPVLAGLLSLGLFWQLARATVRPTAAVLAVGLLVAARWPNTMATSVKPYSLDLLFGITLTSLAYQALRNPQQQRWLILLTAMVPAALLFSYPAVFVAGAVSVVLLPLVWRGRWALRIWFVAYNLLMTGAFLFGFMVGREQLDPEQGTVGNFMHMFWRDGFPPDNLWLTPLWVLRQLTGRMMAYPAGDANFGSTATFLLFGIGAWLCVRQRRWGFLGLCLLPMLLNLVAALVNRYPFGGCCRLSQHVAPAVCLLAGSGLAWVLDHVGRSAAARLRYVTLMCAVFACFAFVQMVMDLVKPYRDTEALWSVRLVQLLGSHRKPADQVVIWNRQKEVEPVMRWQLGRLGNALTWQGDIHWEELEQKGGDLWCLSLWSGAEWVPEMYRSDPARAITRPGWIPLDQASYSLAPWAEYQPRRRCLLTRWVYLGKGIRIPASFTSLEAWPR